MTEVGVIPRDWGVRTFSEVMDGFSSGATPYRRVEEYYDGDILWITSGELDYNVITETLEKISEEAVKNTNLTKLKPGTFLIAITGLEAAGTRGSCGIVGKEATSNQSCMALNPKDEILDLGYLFQYYCYYGDALALEYCQGTKQQSYTGKLVKRLPIILPPTLTEQRAIAGALLDVDGLLSALGLLIGKKEAFKRGMMEGLLSGEIRLEGFDGEWEIKRLGEIGDSIIGLTYKPSDVKNSGTLVLRSSNIQNGVLAFEDNVYVSCEIPNKIRLQKNDLVICVRNGSRRLIGKSAITDNRVIGQAFGAFMSVFRSKYGEYVSYAFQSDLMKAQIEEHLGATINQITNASLNSFKISLPPLPEQHAIATVLSDLDAELGALRLRRAKLEKVKAGMMGVLLTGGARLV